MSDLDFTYSAADIPESSNNYEPVPAGWYNATVTEAGVKETRAGDGKYIKLRFDITGPTNEGRVVFTNLNIRNKNEVAQNIGVEQLGQLMRAVGLPTIQDSSQLVGGSCQINVKIRPASGQYEAQNEVKGYKSINGSALPSGQPAAPAPSPAPAPASGATPPWKR